MAFFEIALEAMILESMVDEAARLLERPKKTEVLLPKVSGLGINEDPVMLSDLVLATLKAVNKAKATLKNTEGIGLGNQPMEFKFTGSFHGLSPDSKDALVKLSLEKKKGENNA